MRVYGYLRVSSDKQDVNSQRQGVETLAVQKGLVIDEWITDDGISGTVVADKRELGPLLKKCEEGDIIICSELSRLGRKLFMVMTILQTLMEKKIRLFTVKDNYELGDNIQSAILAFAFGLAAQIERDMIAARTKEALALRRKLGVLVGRPTGKPLKEPPRGLAENKDLIIRLYEEGYSYKEIGDRIPGRTRGTKTNRDTIGRYLYKWGVWKGVPSGYDVTLWDGSVVWVVPFGKKGGPDPNWVKHGVSFYTINRAANSGEKVLGVTKIERHYDRSAKESYRSYWEKTPKNVDDPRVDRDRLRGLVIQNLLLPEIHAAVPEFGMSYDELYDFFIRDAEFNSLYRLHGHKKVCKRAQRMIEQEDDMEDAQEEAVNDTS